MPYIIHYSIAKDCLSELTITANTKEEADKCAEHIKKMGFKVMKIERPK